MKQNQLLWWSFVVSLGGFLFGFETAVISGCERAIQQQWSLSEGMIGQIVAVSLYGTVIGALFGGIPSDRIGRKKTLFWIAILYSVSAVGTALSPDIWSLMLFRFIGGLAVGASSVVAPMYISEIAPTTKRGRLTAMFQFNLVFGILMAYYSNYLIGSAENEGWRWMLGMLIPPAVLFTLLVPFVPESPRWLIVNKKQVEKARKTLAIINPLTADAEIEAIRDAKPETTSPWSAFFSGKYNFPILLAFLIAFFNQVSGINAVIYYAPRIFSMTGMGDSTALLSTAGIGLINLVFTMLGLALIDKMGRRFLMYVGSIGYIVSLASIALAFFTHSEGGMIVPILLFVFIASHAIGQGAVIWVFISEIFPNHVRALGQSFGCSTHWVMAAIVSGTFPWFAKNFGGGPVFAFFAVMMLFQLLFVWRIMPETKGVSLEELERRLTRASSE
ncbi:MAG: sugar porter family MFS transporter [Saprospiraceae bacterium]|nr:sugar porter family MFS transporter [Saprospiraceae bacterium]